MIPFNRPYFTVKELLFVAKSFSSGHISGNGNFTKKCQEFLQRKYGFKKTLLTTSCTDALEMCAMLLNIKPGDEVIVPSYTFTSTALAFVRQGAVIVFADSRADHPGVDEDKIAPLITGNTKAIVAMHYAGVACDMDKIIDVAEKNKLFVVEDAAQAIGSCYKDRPLGGIGHLGTYSFHETKNIHCGEGGLLIINDERFIERAQILWEKGTDRVKFFRGEIDKYGWVDTGSSFLPADIVAAVLYAQLKCIDRIQERRAKIWDRYYQAFKFYEEKGLVRLPVIPEYTGGNSSIFYMLFSSPEHRTFFIKRMKQLGCMALFHYLPLHKSDFYKDKHDGRRLGYADMYSERLVRLPLYYTLFGKELDVVIDMARATMDEMFK
ncbi:MAG: dTDP-4-amino-4,6-dideoxygalactose transaminase [Candidatus Omnitrophota bacterium]